MNSRSQIALIVAMLLLIAASSQTVFRLFWLYQTLVGFMAIATICAAVFSVSDYLSEKISGNRLCWQFFLIFLLCSWGMSLLHPVLTAFAHG